MKCYAAVKNNVCQQVFCSDNVDVQIDPDVQLFEVDRLHDANDLYFLGGRVLVKPTPPSALYTWDDSSHVWVLDINKARGSVKNQRNLLLQRSDWTQLPDVPLVTKEVWAAYRQALRDITEQTSYPQEVVWPNPPA
jgi:hypothetical protein